MLADTNVIDSRVIELCFEEDNLIKASKGDQPIHSDSAQSDPAAAGAPTTGLLDALIPKKEETQWPSLKDLERSYIEAMLAAQDGDKAAVAAALGVSERSLYRKLSGKR